MSHADPVRALHGQTVLLVEDQFLIRLDLQSVLEEHGAQVIAASNLKHGLAECEANRFDLAILDVNLPDGEVFPLAERLTSAGVPIVFHSGHAKAGELAKDFPHAVLIAKPSQDDALIDAAARQIGNAALDLRQA